MDHKLPKVLFKAEETQQRTDIQQLLVTKVDDHFAQQEWTPEHPHIKEEQEEFWISQQEQLQQQQEFDIKKFPFTPVKCENEEKPDFSQLHQNQSEIREMERPTRGSREHLKTEADEYSNEGPEPASNSDHILHLQLDTDDKASVFDKNGTEDSNDSVDSDFWKETRERQSGSNDGGSIDEKPFSCSKCGQRFMYKYHLEKHIRVTKEKPFNCPECAQRFCYKRSLMDHMKIHTGGKILNCSECGKIFIYNKSLKIHLSIHKGDKPFSCSRCDQRFVSKLLLKRHIRIHTEKKPFGCPVCCKKFSQRSNLYKHMRSHAGEKPFGCSVCDKRFTQRSELISHEDSHRRNPI
ncbi:gastrula zinc finger protein xFG20-1-like [Thalassophryne amazonica]|uniref:gastrula zinc finger protein xFG20-1-like n=1 Tax=Thalassophryne amazonica TaxID=390379 RepID=UPI001471FD04|nr:gastrula zinc finger protein xFG20-1-like [Thalassophryne amazonica]